MKVALDTNVLAYAEGANGAAMRDRALEVIQRLPVGAVVLPVQTLGELFNVLVRKAKRRPARARAAVLSWRDAYPIVETSAARLYVAGRHRNQPVCADTPSSIGGITHGTRRVIRGRGRSRQPLRECQGNR